ncbi:hypothetical protein NDU88_001037 [Pleurodeles waltl]|uniref:Uncharacterized protein n=1 Tax=Pleurodeles waltl TaxID=8319 RepID=A0AAV7L9V4_PLEWA|nr:hypothetical protein NDU88_001037 [Pleurodeles waltl]
MCVVSRGVSWEILTSSGRTPVCGRVSVGDFLERDRRRIQVCCRAASESGAAVHSDRGRLAVSAASSDFSCGDHSAVQVGLGRRPTAAGTGGRSSHSAGLSGWGGAPADHLVLVGWCDTGHGRPTSSPIVESRSRRAA